MTRFLGGWVLWFVPLFWLWMLLCGDWNHIDLIAGGCGAAVASSLAEAARRAGRVPIAITGDLIGAAGSALAMVFCDFAVLVYLLACSLLRRRVASGRYLTRPFQPGPKTTRAGSARRAWTVLLAGYSPNAYVVDIDVDRQTVLLHDLVPWRRSERPA